MTTNKHNEALAQIELMQRLVNGSNKLFFSGRKIIVIGIILCLIVPCESIFTSLLTGIGSLPQTLIRIAFYWGLSWSGIKLFAKKTSVETQLTPTLQSVLTLHNVILRILILLNIALAIGGLADLILPFNFILLGLLFNLFGHFSLKPLIYVAWSYILIGLAGLALHQYLPDWSWIVELYYLGVSYIGMGIFLEQHKNA